jgi:hypothetical protein
VNGLRFAALGLAGSKLTSRLVVHPALWRLPHDAQVKAEKAIYHGPVQGPSTAGPAPATCCWVLSEPLRKKEPPPVLACTASKCRDWA